jgi:hypothetical protein
MSDKRTDASPATPAESAASFAARLLAAAARADDARGGGAVQVSTAEICRAMGKPDGATMEEVKSYACEVARHLHGRGVTVGCGCGYLSLMVFTNEAQARAAEEDRELCAVPLEQLTPPPE